MTANRPTFPDSIINRCLIGRSKSKWAWACIDCGESGITGGKKTYAKYQSELAAKAHRCNTTSDSGVQQHQPESTP